MSIGNEKRRKRSFASRGEERRRVHRLICKASICSVVRVRCTTDKEEIGSDFTCFAVIGSKKKRLVPWTTCQQRKEKEENRISLA